MKKIRDVNSKVIFHDPILCSQFLRDNTGIPLLQNVQPEDIEDVSAQYQLYSGTEFESDTVKKIRIYVEGKETALYMISLIEHKSQVDYNVTMQMIKYMVLIWTEYAREMEKMQKGCSKNKGFRYPPILPVVYYEGTDKWTADLHLKDRILLKEVFGEYIPDFSYRLIRIHDYTNEELLLREDEMSLIMMINKVQTPQDLKLFLEANKQQIDKIIQNAPERILTIIANTIKLLCDKMNVPESETRQCVEKVKGRQMGYLFENMEKMDIQAERRNTKKARQELQKAQKKAEQRLQRAQKKAEQKAERDVKKTQQTTIIETMRELGCTDAMIIDKLVKKCEMTEESAKRALKLHDKK